MSMCLFVVITAVSNSVMIPITHYLTHPCFLLSLSIELLLCKADDIQLNIIDYYHKMKSNRPCIQEDRILLRSSFNPLLIHKCSYKNSDWISGHLLFSH